MFPIGSDTLLFFLGHGRHYHSHSRWRAERTGVTTAIIANVRGIASGVHHDTEIKVESALDLIQRPACAISSHAIDFYLMLQFSRRPSLEESNLSWFWERKNTKAKYLLSPLSWIFRNRKNQKPQTRNKTKTKKGERRCVGGESAEEARRPSRQELHQQENARSLSSMEGERRRCGDQNSRTSLSYSVE